MLLFSPTTLGLAAITLVLRSVRGRDTSSAEVVRVSVSDALERSSLANIHLDWIGGSKDGTHRATYGPCHDGNHADTNTQLARFSGSPDRLAWAIAEDAQSGGCIKLFDDQSGQLLGSSESLLIQRQPMRKRAQDQLDHPLLKNFDSLGAWFDGVAKIQQRTANEGAVVAKSKNVSIAIVGAGVSGLATGLMLDSVGVHNWRILEASGRVGGRFRTM